MSYVSQFPASVLRQFKETRVGASPNGLTARAVWAVWDVADLWAACQVVIGTPQVINGSIARIVPLIFPDTPTPCMVAQNLDVELTGWTKQYNYYSSARLTVDFATPQYNLTGSGAFQVINKRSAVDIVTVPGSAVTVGGVQLNQDAGIQVGVVGYDITQYFVPSLDNATIDSLTGCVNSTTFLGYSAGYVLFEGTDSEIQTNGGFTTSYQITFHFKYRAQPWGYVVSPSGSWSAATFSGGGSIFPSADLNALLV